MKLTIACIAPSHVAYVLLLVSDAPRAWLFLPVVTLACIYATLPKGRS